MAPRLFDESDSDVCAEEARRTAQQQRTNEGIRSGLLAVVSKHVGLLGQLCYIHLVEVCDANSEHKWL